MKKIIAVFLTMLVLHAFAPSLSAETLPADLTEGSQLVGLLITRVDLSVYTGQTGILLAACTQKEPDLEEEYVFGDVNGLRLICFMAPDEAGDMNRMVSNVDDGISSVHFDMDENGGSMKMEAEISFVPGQEDELVFYNPVMLAASGQVYAVPGDFMAVNAAMNPPGSAVGQTIRDERKHMVNGVEITDSTTVAVQINAVREPVEIRLLQFSENHELLKSEGFLPGTVPDQIVPLAEADYLLLETVEKDSFIRREVIGRDTDYLNTLSCRMDGICIYHYHDVSWK